jgi:hypothetical protein
MSRPITRQDFLDGIALAIGAGLSLAKLFDQSTTGAAYPPGLTGWRGGDWPRGASVTWLGDLEWSAAARTVTCEVAA